MSEARSTVRFGIFEADLRTGELRKNGLKIRLEGQPFQILRLLLQRPGELVTREELKQALWPSDTFVDFEVSINAAVKRLRQALDDSADNPRFVETLPRRGYRFICPLLESPSAELPSSRPAQRTIAVLASIIAIAVSATWQAARYIERRNLVQMRSLAVLPLENLTGDPEQQYVVDGIHDELITELAQISSLKVISRTSVLRYRQQKKSLPEIAQELGVNGILEGTVRLGGDRVRMTVQLISARDDRHLWARTYDADPRDLTRLPAQIAWNLADTLHLSLSPQERSALADAKGVDPAVWKLYFKAGYFASKWTKDDLWKAVGYYRETLDLDPTYAPAWSGLGECYERLAGQAGEDTRSNAVDALQKAIQLDPAIRTPHQVLGRLKLAAWDWEGAAAEFARAREVDPNWPGPAVFLLTTGKPEEAVAAERRNAERDPLNYSNQLVLGWTYYMAGHYDEAIAQLQKTIRIDPTIHHAYYEIAWAYVKKGMFQEAISNCETAAVKLQQRRSDTAVVGTCGWVYAVAGRQREALEIARKLEDKQGEEPAVQLAHIYDALGQREKTLAFLQKAYDAHAGKFPGQWKSPMLSDGIKSDPRFQELIRRTGNPWAKFGAPGQSLADITPKSGQRSRQ
ncbi:MAG: tetratricopeptide repeat protein [Terriglobales bacterium]